MKKYLFILLLVAFIPASLNASKVTAYLMHATFNVPGKNPYIETYLSVIGSTVQFNKNLVGRYQGIIEINIAFRQNGEIKQANKYTLNSPEIEDTTKGFPNFIDQQRYSLPNGEYEMEIAIADISNLNDKPFAAKIPIKIDYTESMITMSSIELLESYTKALKSTSLTKSGYDLLPYVSNYYPENASRLRFYAETYNAKKYLGETDKILFSYYIEAYETKTKLSDYSSFQKQSAAEVNVVLAEFIIEKLPSGNYNLVIELRDKENKIQAEQKCFFQRKNALAEVNFIDLKSIDVTNTFVSGYKNVDSLKEFVSCIRPISSTAEIQFSETQVKGKNPELMQQYFYNFWKSRDANNPEKAWLDYYKEVIIVNKEFGTYGLKGYDTERGRVYLQYGKPDLRNKIDNEPGAYPYEIWQYFTLVDKSLVLNELNNKQANKKFVFYNPDLVTNKYQLIHSDARGEVNNPRWELLIYSRDTQNGNIDAEKAPDRMGSGAGQLFNDPR